MSIFIKEMVKIKFSQLSEKDLLDYGHLYGFSLSKEEAEHIITYIKSHPIDPFNKIDRLQTLQKLAEITNVKTANKAESLFDEIIQSYGLKHLFDE